MSKNIVLIFAVSFLLGGFLGFYIERQRAINNMETAKLSMQNQINEAKTANERLMTENKQLQLSLTPTPTEGAKKVTPTPLVKKK